LRCGHTNFAQNKIKIANAIISPIRVALNSIAALPVLA
jgi:hypothetical protein